MKIILRAILPILVLGVSWWGSQYLIKHRKEAVVQPSAKAPTRVEGTRLRKVDHQVLVRTYGTVQPRTESTLIPEVPGKIIEVSPALREGGFFEKDEALLKIDRRDYDTRLAVARRNLAQAESLLEVEKARGVQAVENWKRLGKEGEPSALALRVPQMEETKAQVEAAKAEVAKAERDLARTEIRAPYAGYIEEKMVDVGQYVTTGTLLAKAFAIEYVEVPLPITNEQLAYLDLPESYRQGSGGPRAPQPEVVLWAEIGSTKTPWKGRIIRVSGAFDEKTRQLFAIAQVDDPYGKRPDGAPPLKVGLFVSAEIQGKAISNVFVIPRTAIRASDEVIVIDEQSRMWRRKVTPLLREEKAVIIAAGKQGEDGLEEGEVLCTTPIAFPVHGAPVIATIDGKRMEVKDLAAGQPQTAKDAKPQQGKGSST